MSDKPSVDRIADRLVLNEPAAQLIRSFAEKYGEDPERLLQDITKGGPAATLLVKLLDVNVSARKRGRPVDDERFKLIYHTIGGLIGKMKPADAYRTAAAMLEKQGVTGPGGKRLTLKTMREVYSEGSAHRQENLVRAWFDPSAVPPDDET